MDTDTDQTQETSDTAEEVAKNGFICHLADGFRVVHDGRSKPYGSWQLQRLKSNGEWMPMSFCQTRAALLTAIHEKIERGHAFYGRGAKNIAVDPAALEVIRALPERAY